MSEKIEFIPAKDLPVAEGDEVDVLCVENGALKRKEGASLGGSGGYDMIIACDTHIFSATVDNITVQKGAVADIVKKLRNLEPVSIAIVIANVQYGSYSGNSACFTMASVRMAGGDNEIAVRFIDSDLVTSSKYMYEIILCDENLATSFGKDVI